MRNYHGEQVEFSVGQEVTFVDDGGAEHSGTILDIDGDLLHIEFKDAEAGWENCLACY